MNTPTPEEAREAVEFLYERAHEFMPSSAGTLISSDTLRRFIDAHSAPVMVNGLTEAETTQTASVAGLSKPVQPEPVAWVPVAERMPKSGATVLACYTNRSGNVRRIRAEWVAAKTIESDGDSEIGEYDEATDCCYDPEGWYEKIDNWGDYSSVVVNEGEVTHWMPLPAHPDASPPPAQPATDADNKLGQHLQQRCVDWGAYWRASDAHGVNLTLGQALELLRTALGVEVEIADAAQPKREPLTDEDIKAEFAKVYPKDIGILELAEHNPDYRLEAIGARHHWSAFLRGARAIERLNVRACADAAIERCAQVCEEIEASAWALWKLQADPTEQGRNIGAQHCADAIRALKGKPA